MAPDPPHEPDEARLLPPIDLPDPLQDAALDADLSSTNAGSSDEEWVDRLVAAIRAGTWIRLAPDGHLPDPADAGQWPAERTIPAAAIRTALFSKDLDPDPHGLQIYGARITGDLDFNNATLPCRVGITYSHLPRLRAIASTIPALALNGSHVSELVLDQVTINGSLSLQEIHCNRGEVRAIGATINGHVNLNGATLTNPDKTALDLANATITGDMFLSEGFTAHGEVRAIGATINGQVNLNGATLTNPGKNALSLTIATITGAMLLNEGFTAHGEVRASYATISGQFELHGATLTNPGKNALSLINSTINGAMLLDGDCNIDGRLDLSYARIGILVTPREPVGRLVAIGWRLTEVHGSLWDWRCARAWLDTAPSWMAFAASAWHELANVLDRQGRPSDAKRLRIAAAWRITRRSNTPALMLRILYGLFAGYGYWPLLAAAWLIGTVLGAIAVVHFNPWAFETLDATQKAIGLNPWLYGIASVLPAVTLPGLDKWIITEGWVALCLVGLKLFGWLQTGILLAGLTGLLKKT